MKSKLLIFIVAYNAKKTIVDVINRIPQTIQNDFDSTLLIIDDSSKDNTQELALKRLKNGSWSKYLVLRNQKNQGYGGNQKIGYQFAIQNNFDIVVLLHGDGQYGPEHIPSLLAPFRYKNKPDAVFGSRMMLAKDALRGGMPYYKFVGNKILTYIQNKLLGSNLSEFHSGFRVYAVDTLKRISFELNTNDFHFDTEIIVQLFSINAKVIELPISTYYGNEVCHVNGIEYALNVIKTSIKAKLIKLGIFFDPKFTYITKNNRYIDKFSFYSTHLEAFNQITNNSTILDLGCADGFISERLHKEKNCKVFSVDIDDHKKIRGCNYQSCDLNHKLPTVPWGKIDTIILLDVIEHLKDPEDFLRRLRHVLNSNKHVNIIVSSGNVCFFITRFMMLFGQFNYGPRGILDITHTRLFTIRSLKRILEYEGYQIMGVKYIPGPYPLALGLNLFSKFLIISNRFLSIFLPGLFSYQSLFKVKPLAETTWLLKEALKSSKDK